MSAGESVSYEVYKLVRGRWSMHARFGDGERDVALAEAAAQELTQTVQACCIIQETYRVADNAAMESVVYHSASLSEPPSIRAVTREQVADPIALNTPRPQAETPAAPETVVASPPRPAVSAGRAAAARAAPVPGQTAPTGPVQEDDAASEPAPPMVAPKPAFSESDAMVEFSIFEAVLRFFAVLFLSLLGGTLLGAVLFFILKLVPSLGLSMTTDQARTIILSAGLLGAVASFYPLLRFLLPDMTLSKGDGQAGMAAARVGGAMMPGMGQQTPALAGATAGGGDTAALRRQPPPPPPPVRVGGFDAEDAGGEASPAGLGMPAEAPASAAAASEGTAADDAQPPAEDQPAPSPVPSERRNEPEDVAAVKEGLRTLADEAREAVVASKGPLDPYRAFGMTLFLAGAGETLGRWHSVTQRRVAKAVAAIVEGLGAPAENAAGFAYHIDEYLLEPRFHDMYAAGRSSAVHRQYDDETPSGIVEAMQDWSRPAPAVRGGDAGPKDNGVVSVMLTRVTTEAPDGGRAPVAAEFVRIHDEIARETLGRYGRREIKHTGEGVLVSYSSAAAAVEAASSIQQLFRRFRESRPDVLVAVSIVVAAGAPIQKTSDPRLTPVRIAAALMPHADGDDVLVAPPVPDLMKGEMFRFERAGTFQIAGVPEPLALFRVNW